MEKELLLVVLPETAPAVFEALGELAGAFSDNGGDPDGWGPYLASLDQFEVPEIVRALDAGAYIAEGWRVRYRGGNPSIPEPWCGYGALEVAYTLSSYAARALERYLKEGQDEEEMNCHH